jgi:hypothetical protein
MTMRAAFLSLAAVASVASCHIVSGLGDFRSGSGGAGGSGVGGGGAIASGGGGAGTGGEGAGVTADSGQLEWLVGFQGGNDDRGRGLAVRGGNVVFIADFDSDLDVGTANAQSNGAGDILVARLDAADGATTPVVDGFGSGGDEIAQAIALGPDGSIYSCGTYSDAFQFAGQQLVGIPNYAGFLTKHDAGGNQLWARSFVGNSEASCAGVAVDGTHVYATGFFIESLQWLGPSVNTTGGNGYLAKLDFDGNPVALATFEGGDVSCHSVAAADGKVVVTGNAFNAFTVGGGNVDYVGPGEDLFVVQLDSALTLEWQTTVGGPGEQQGEWIALSDSGRVAVGARYTQVFPHAGNDHAGDGSVDGAVLLVNADGVPAWAAAFRGPGSDSVRSVAFDGSGNAFAAIEFEQSVEVGVGGPTQAAVEGSVDAMVLRFGNDAEVVWHRALGSDGFDAAWGVTMGANRLYAVGQTGGPLSHQGQMLPYDGGAEVWVAAFVP